MLERLLAGGSRGFPAVEARAFHEGLRPAVDRRLGVIAGNLRQLQGRVVHVALRPVLLDVFEAFRELLK
eukprot:6464085-Pyramimonas_sp.AAC.1